ncbi:alpha/beta fold hydrolase [Baekduia sp.]|jgi:pimeloyl-ACP methyl ester carboxylesterase|uniref:alpha/beta fold hydrolase n=1 Tax=Baekduia sp. TaxID=2600305 RepID=UPI002DF99A41|nr:alpha/beta fold hydrolase [Baekduia sp.]
MSRRLAVPAALTLSLALATSAAAAPKTVTKVRTGPSGEAFYAPPSPLPGKKHGDLIWARTLTGAAVASGASSTKVVLYRSQGVDGKADAVSGIVSIPKGKAPKKGWPIITYAHGTTGIADQCAPSRDVAGTLVHPFNAYILPLISRWLKAGYAVVRTDYEGLGTPGVHPYLIGNSEGRATLDIARAARELDPRLSKTTIISGHSQGGHAALFAAALAPKWTPELKLRGTVAFAPASHLDDQIPLTSILTTPGGGLSGLIADIGRGILTANPSFDLTALLSDQANALFGQVEAQCLPELSAPTSFGGLSPKAIFKDGADLAPLAKLLDVQDPSHLKIKTPLLIDQGSADTTVLPLFTDQLAGEMTKNGNKDLTYTKYTGVDHAGIVTAAAKDATAWIAKRLK